MRVFMHLFLCGFYVHKKTGSMVGSKPLNLQGNLVEPSGIEPLTSTLPVLRSPS